VGETWRGWDPSLLSSHPYIVHVAPRYLAPPNLLPLLDESNVCALSQESFPTTIEQSLIGAHESLQAKASFPTVVESEAENLPPPGADSGVAIFSRIRPNISFPQQA